MRDVKDFMLHREDGSPPHPTGPVAPRATPEKCSTVAAEPNAIRAGPVAVTTCKLETKNMVRPDSVGHRLHSYTSQSKAASELPALTAGANWA